MKPEFLKNLKVGDQQLTQEVVDAILAEHQRIVAANTTEITSLKDQLKTAKDGLKAFDGVDVAKLQGQITQLQKDLEDKDAAHQTELANMAFDRALDAAITGAKGRNAKAIKALLDLDALRGSKNQEADIKSALDGLQKDSGYLFDTGDAPPRLAPGPGVNPPAGGNNPFSFNFGGIRAVKDGK